MNERMNKGDQLSAPLIYILSNFCFLKPCKEIEIYTQTLHKMCNSGCPNLLEWNRF